MRSGVTSTREYLVRTFVRCNSDLYHVREATRHRIVMISSFELTMVDATMIGLTPVDPLVVASKEAAELAIGALCST